MSLWWHLFDISTSFELSVSSTLRASARSRCGYLGFLFKPLFPTLSRAFFSWVLYGIVRSSRWFSCFCGPGQKSNLYELVLACSWHKELRYIPYFTHLWWLPYYRRILRKQTGWHRLCMAYLFKDFSIEVVFDIYFSPAKCGSPFDRPKRWSWRLSSIASMATWGIHNDTLGQLGFSCEGIQTTKVTQPLFSGLGSQGYWWPIVFVCCLVFWAHGGWCSSIDINSCFNIM